MASSARSIDRACTRTAGSREPAQQQVRDRRREVVKTGDIVKVRVLEVDLARKRVSLTMKLDAPTAPRGDSNSYKPAARGERSAQGPRSAQPQAQPQGASAMAAAFAKLQTKR